MAPTNTNFDNNLHDLFVLCDLRLEMMMDGKSEYVRCPFHYCQNNYELAHATMSFDEYDVV